MIKKVVHISDIHIRNIKMHEQTKVAFNVLIKGLKKLRKTYKYDEIRLVIVGDLFHQKITVSNEQFMLAHKFLKTCVEYCPIVIIAGNHDLLENNKDRLDSITPIVDVLGNHNIHYFKESKCYPDDNIVWCVYSVFENNAPPDIKTARVDHGNDKKYLGLFHAPLIGSKTDTGYGFEFGTSLGYFDGCDAVLLGDIHMRQTLEKDGVNLVYPGSFIQQNYGESIENHGYLLWDTETLTYEVFNIDTGHKLYKFEINSIDDIENNKEKLMNP